MDMSANTRPHAQHPRHPHCTDPHPVPDGHPARRTRLPTARADPCTAPTGTGTHAPLSRLPPCCPHLPSASKRRQAPRKAAASRRPSAPLSMVLLPARGPHAPSAAQPLPRPRRRPRLSGRRPRPGGGPAGVAGGSLSFAGARPIDLPPARVPLRRVWTGVVAGRSSAVEVGWSSPTPQPLPLRKSRAPLAKDL